MKATAFSGFGENFIPGLKRLRQCALAAFRGTDAHLLFGPRSGSKLGNFEIPETLPPGPLQAFLPLKVAEVSSLKPGLTVAVEGEGLSGAASRWLERLKTALPSKLATEDGQPVMVADEKASYLGAWLDSALLHALFGRLLDATGIARVAMPEPVRLVLRGKVAAIFNDGPEPSPPAACCSASEPCPTGSRDLRDDALRGFLDAPLMR